MVLETDAPNPDARERENLYQYVIAPALETLEADIVERIRTAERPLLLTDPGLLGRLRHASMTLQVDAMSLINTLRETAAEAGRAVWMLVPCNRQHDRPFIDDRAIPGYGQAWFRRIPSAWLMEELEMAG